MQLTGPNRPIGSITPPCTAIITAADTSHAAETGHSHATNTAPEPTSNQPAQAQHKAPGELLLGRPGGHGGEPTPDPIPNSDVKTPSAYDTAPQGAGKSVAARSSKHHIKHTNEIPTRGGAAR